MTLIANILHKYSKAQLINFFQTQALNPNQLSLEYLKDPKKITNLLNNIIDRHIKLRDAYSNPLDPINAKYIEEYYKYLYDPLNRENAQLRGPQCHMCARMSEDFARAGNGIQYTHLSAQFISSSIPIYTENKPVIHFPSTFHQASPKSAQQSYEAVGATVLSGFTGDSVYLTDDDPNNIPTSKLVYNNIPSTQSVGDFAREIVIYSNKKPIKIFPKEEHKSQALGIAMSTKNIDEPRVISTGTLGSSEEKNANIIIAQRCIMGFIKIKHQDPSKNTFNNQTDDLNKVIQTGEISHLKEYIGVPFIFSNKHHDPNNNS